jgi:hypothetical protein
MSSIEQTDIFDLYDQLKQTNRVLYNWVQDETDIELPWQFKEAQELSELISGKPKLVRESWFSNQAHSLCGALQKEDYRSADIIITDIKYFAHCFLQDSDFKKDTRTETLKLIAETIS